MIDSVSSIRGYLARLTFQPGFSPPFWDDVIRSDETMIHWTHQPDLLVLQSPAKTNQTCELQVANGGDSR